MMKKKNKEEVVEKVVSKNLNHKETKDLIRMLLTEHLDIDIDKIEDKKRTFGDKIADIVTRIAGSWLFIIIFASLLFTWMLLNGIKVINIDPFPYILLNLILSCIAALQAPIIMMSQNRRAKKDSLRSLNDYKVDLKSELILEVLHKEMEKIKKDQKKILRMLEQNKNN